MADAYYAMIKTLDDNSSAFRKLKREIRKMHIIGVRGELEALRLNNKGTDYELRERLLRKWIKDEDSRLQLTVPWFDDLDADQACPPRSEPWEIPRFWKTSSNRKRKTRLGSCLESDGPSEEDNMMAASGGLLNVKLNSSIPELTANPTRPFIQHQGEIGGSGISKYPWTLPGTTESSLTTCFAGTNTICTSTVTTSTCTTTTPTTYALKEPRMSNVPGFNINQTFENTMATLQQSVTSAMELLEKMSRVQLQMPVQFTNHTITQPDL